MTDETDWRGDLFPGGQQRSSYRQDHSTARGNTEMTNFGVIENGRRDDYVGQGPGYIAPGKSRLRQQSSTFCFNIQHYSSRMHNVCVGVQVSVTAQLRVMQRF